jgi:hypothetical protein
MNRFDGPQQGRETLATLTRHISVRVLNCSADGCLFEATAPLAVGTVAALRVSFEGSQFDEQIQVVRCEARETAGVLHFIGARFLSTTPPFEGTLRHKLRCDVGGLADWSDARIS